MSEIIEIQVICDFEPVTIQVFDSGAGVSVHGELTGRELPNQHPASAISIQGTQFDDVQELADYVDDSETLTFDGETIIGAGTGADPLRVEQRIQFFPTQQVNDFTITADMLFKLVKINSATDVDVTIANMVIGSAVYFHLLGAGLPVFLEGVSQSITGVDEDGKPLGTDRTDVLLQRFENDGATEIYNVI